MPDVRSLLDLGRPTSHRGSTIAPLFPAWTPWRTNLNAPGHTVHVIQARHGWEERKPMVPGRLLAVEENLIVVRTAGRERRSSPQPRLRAGSSTAAAATSAPA